ncbi:F-box only protein 36 [Anthophora plagiata]
MSSKLEYLEKYSVAPSPSRDYYGLRVSNDKVILYLWRISHGPHKTPLVRTSDFDDFNRDYQLQEEIRRIFGEYLLKHVRNIASGNNTLLTLPKCLIEKLIKYLTVQDIAKLSSLSHISKEIFDDNFVWATLYKKYKRTKNKYEESRIYTYNWKQLFQLGHMQGVINEQKMLRNRPTAKQTKANTKLENFLKADMKIENLTKDPRIENLTKTFNSSFKAATKGILLDNQISRKSADISRRRIAQNPVLKKLSDNRLEEFANEKEKAIPEKKPLHGKSAQMIGQKNTKASKEQSIVVKNISKREIDSKDTGNKVTEVKSNKIPYKSKKIDSKSSNMSIKATEEKPNNVKSKNSTVSKINKTEKPVSRVVQGDQTKSKTKGKTKKIGQSKSTILNTTTAFLNDRSPIKDDSFDLADLIEASLKNIHSPRSIFDYSFSCIEKSKSCGGDTKLQDISAKMADHPRALKSGHIKASLDRLSEKSEPLTAKSIDSVGNSETSRSSVTPKCAKMLNAELKKSTIESSRNRCKIIIPEGKADHFERYGIYNKYPTPRMQDHAELKKSSIRKEVDKMNVLRSLGTKVLRSKTVDPNATVDVNRQEARKMMDNMYKYL